MISSKIDLFSLADEELLELRICDLPLEIKGSWLEECVDQLYDELNKKSIIFRPFCYLADEWLTPDEEPIIGIPFFLAHPALMKLEKKIMHDVEGGNKTWCMKLLHHEAGHAINYAYKLFRRKKWQKVFGKFSLEYGDTYRFRPYSKNFVRHLEDYYAQYHPDEDFAETFAVWLTPNSDWQNQYKGWKALDKLQYVQELMDEVKNKEPLVKKEKLFWQASKIKIRLKNFYKKKKSFYAEDFPDFHDMNLNKIFTTLSDKTTISAFDLLNRYKNNIAQNVFIWTGEKKYIIDDLIMKLKQRCKALGLYLVGDADDSLIKISVYLTVLIMNYLHTGKFRSGRCKRS